MLQQFAFKQQALLNSKITNEKHKNEKNKNRLWKGHSHAIWELKEEGGELPCLTSAETGVLGNSNFPVLCTCLCDLKSAVSTDFGGAS